ncbi:hypothetical protein BsWGS_21374 [Bradybaena similaris]
MKCLLLIALAAFAGTLTHCQLTIPPRSLGFVYLNGEDSADVKIAAYIDLTCPDSQAAFPTLLTVAKLYYPYQVQLKLYLFSLPYHRNSHTLSKAAHVLNAYKSPKNATVYDWFTTVYKNIDSLATAATVDKTDVEVLNYVASLAFDVSGIPEAEFIAGVSNADIDSATRLEWKYGCTRGVYGTPLFTVNDVFVNADPTWSVTQWVDLIKSLLNTKRKNVVV